ncbi:MAG TPA: HEAT repeat domain-containing protein, partial [Burkholderiaceae bacterium]|nr:HEAT repeat domain-containing protein [Burkholderiaceae bacterium]
MCSNKDWHNAMFLLMAAEVHLSDRYRNVLCALLDMKAPSFPNEYAVEVLTSLADSSCLPVLTALVHHQFSGDPDKQIAIKAMDAIANIDDPRATAFLKQLRLSDDLKLAEEAEYLLSND